MPDPLPVTIRDMPDDADWPVVADLFRAVGWGEHAPEALWSRFAASAVARFAYEDADAGRLVGVCRAISDGSGHALIVDLVVAPDRQRRGVGRRLLASVCDALSDVRNVHLLSTPDNEPFYDAAGFARQPLTAFIRRNARD